MIGGENAQNLVWNSSCGLNRWAAPAQDYNRNLIECLNELGLHPDPSYAQKLQSDPAHRTLRMWYPQSEAQFAVVNDCVVRKANLAPKPSAKRPPRGSR
jgi:hypothetical protein